MMVTRVGGSAPVLGEMEEMNAPGQTLQTVSISTEFSSIDEVKCAIAKRHRISQRGIVEIIGVIWLELFTRSVWR
jgi:hypothetical protein